MRTLRRLAEVTPLSKGTQPVRSPTGGLVYREGIHTFFLKEISKYHQKTLGAHHPL